MSPARIVEALDEFEDGHARFGLRLEATPIEQLTFERGEETLRHRLLAKAPARLQINDHIAEPVDYPPSADLPRADNAEAAAEQQVEA